MSCKFTDLHCKEVICITDGRRLGFIADAKIELPEGKISAVIVPCPCRFPSIPGRREDYVIPWNCIRRIGPDIILVDIRPEDCRTPRTRHGLLL